MLARALLLHQHDRTWVLGKQDVSSPYSTYRRTVRWFNDQPSDASPFSLHRLIAAQRHMLETLGETHPPLGAGSWFAPTEVACMLRETVHEHFASTDGAVRVFVARDGELNTRALARLCCDSADDDDTDTDTDNDNDNDGDIANDNSAKPTTSSNGNDATATAAPALPRSFAVWHTVILIIPVRLGVDKLHESYVEPLSKLFTMPQTLGIFGGRPRQSLYFVGMQGQDVLFLDPHVVQR